MGIILRAATHKGKYGASIHRVIGIRAGSFMLEPVGRRGMTSSVGWEFEACEPDLFQVCSVNGLGERLHSYILVTQGPEELVPVSISASGAMEYAAQLNEGKSHDQAAQAIFQTPESANSDFMKLVSGAFPGSPRITIPPPRVSAEIILVLDGKSESFNAHSIVVVKDERTPGHEPWTEIIFGAQECLEFLASRRTTIAAIVFQP